MIPAPISTHPSRPRRRRFAVRRWPGWLMWLSLLSVGADAHIGPLLGITCVAPVGRGDHTPPSVHSRSPRWQGPSSRQFSVGSERLPHRVGADLCVRPETPPPRTRPRANTSVGPYGSSWNLHQPLKTGRGQSPAPTGLSRQGQADVPRAWPPPAKFRHEIWGVGHRHRPLRKRHRRSPATQGCALRRRSILHSQFPTRPSGRKEPL